MKTRRTIMTVIALLLVAAGTVKAQQSLEFAPVGAEWYYNRYYRIGPTPDGITYDRFRSLRTIEINGWECKEIELYQHLDCNGVPNPYSELRYINQEGDQVFEVEDGQRFLLYDFSKSPGESWYAPKYQTTVTVQNISYLTLNDETVRKVLEIHPSNIDWYFDRITEGIGMEYSLFPFDIGITGSPCVNGPLRCYSENGIPLIEFEIPPVGHETPCDYEVLSIHEQEQIPLAISNTIVDDVLQIDFSETLAGRKDIVVFDMAGRLIYSENTMDQSVSIQLTEIPSGFYVTRIQTADQMIHVKCIKQ